MRPPSGSDTLEALFLLVQRRLISTLTELLAEARRLASEEDDTLISFLEMQDGALPPHLALAKFEVWALEQRHWDTTALIADAENRAIAIIPPLPPHLFKLLLPLPGVRIVQLDEHDVPSAFRVSAIGRSHEDVFAARRYARQAEIIAFDGHLSGHLKVRAELADLLDGLPNTPRLLCHLRPHPDPSDEDFPGALRASITFI